MFYQHRQHHRQLHHLSGVKCRVILGCLAGGYVLCVSAMIVLNSSSSQDLYQDSRPVDYDSDVEVVHQKQSRALHAVVNLEQPNVEQLNVKQSNVNQPPVNQPYIKQHNEGKENVEQPNYVKQSADFYGSVIQETFTTYQFDDNDGAVNTIPKPQVEKRPRNKAVIMGHRKVKRRRGSRYSTPPIFTNLDGNSVTGLAP